jgi:hypothetical protein
MSIGNHAQQIQIRLEINLFTSAPTLLRRCGYSKAKGSKLILTASSSSRKIGTRFFAPLGVGVIEEPTTRS